MISELSAEHWRYGVGSQDTYMCGSGWLGEEQSIWHQFSLYQDAEGIWRCRGRLENASLPPEQKYPIFLERQNHVTTLIVLDCHKLLGHTGVNSILTELRTRCWVTQGRQSVKKVIHDCVICRRYQCKPYRGPPPPPLPLMRVETKPPFSYTGVGLAGPIYAREFLASNTRKLWICLFTCLVTRAVHLELVSEMSVASFLRCSIVFTMFQEIYKWSPMMM